MSPWRFAVAVTAALVALAAGWGSVAVARERAWPRPALAAWPQAGQPALIALSRDGQPAPGPGQSRTGVSSTQSDPPYVPSPSDPPPGPGLDRLDPVPPWADLYDQPARAVTAPRSGQARSPGRTPGRGGEVCARQRIHCLSSCGDIADEVVRAGCRAGCDHARERCERAVGEQPGTRP